MGKHYKFSNISALYLAFFAIILITIGSFYKMTLEDYSGNLKSNLERIFNDDMVNGNVLKITRTLGTLSHDLNWNCISAHKANQVTFSLKRANCEPNFFSRKVSVFIPERPEIKVWLTLRMPKSLELLYLFFTLVVVILFASFLGIVRSMNQKLIKSELDKRDELTNLSLKIAHDIRSPLELIKTVISRKDEINFDLLDKSVERIQDISNGLLLERRNKIKKESLTSIKKLCSDAILFKKSENKTKIDFENKVDDQLVRVDPQKFHRILSNFFNNSIDAGGKKISVSSKVEQNHILIFVQDNGRGIPSEILKSLGKEQVTFGKDEGNGLGVFSSVETIRSWGGDVTFSNNDIGALVSIHLPIEEKVIEEGASYVLLDDDPLVRITWESMASKKDKLLKTYSRSEDLFRDLGLFSKDTLFFVDYELEEDKLGTEYLKLLKDKGFDNLFLCTAHEPSFFEKKGVEGVVTSKEPPF